MARRKSAVSDGSIEDRGGAAGAGGGMSVSGGGAGSPSIAVRSIVRLTRLAAFTSLISPGVKRSTALRLLRVPWCLFSQSTQTDALGSLMKVQATHDQGSAEDST